MASNVTTLTCPLANAFVHSVPQTLCAFGAPNFPDWSPIVSSWLRVRPAFPLSGRCARIPGRTVRGDLQTVVLARVRREHITVTLADTMPVLAPPPQKSRFAGARHRLVNDDLGFVSQIFAGENRGCSKLHELTGLPRFHCLLTLRGVFSFSEATF